ncbi:MAG: hypothetical protein Q9202_004988 [Teloschistes flavicans]
MTGLSSYNVYPQSLTAGATYTLSLHRTGQYGIQRAARFRARLLDEPLKALYIANYTRNIPGPVNDTIFESSMRQKTKVQQARTGVCPPSPPFK